MKTVQEKGYTILELMIVVAVSASMFGIVATTFGGRQQQVQFTQAVRDFDSLLKDIRNDVSLGYYPANESVTCNATNSVSPEPIVNPGTADDLGSNADCISIGKVIQFSPQGPYEFTASGDQIIKIYNVVGLRIDANGGNPTNVVDSVPTAIPDPEESLLKWGLRVKRVRYINNANIATDTKGIAIFTKLNRGSKLQANASDEAVQVSAIPNVTADLSESDMINQQINNIDTKITSGTMNFNTASQIVICVTDADDNRKATITFGGRTSGSIIDFDNYNAADCS